MCIKKIFAKNVRFYREKLSMSQEELAFKTSLHRTYISAVERERRSISLNNIEKIAKALEVEAYQLFIIDNSKKEEGNE